MATITPNAYKEYQDYFTNTAPGATRQWAGGTQTMGDDGISRWTSGLGNTIEMGADTNLLDIYNNPYAQEGITDTWDNRYGNLFSSQKEPVLNGKPITDEGDIDLLSLWQPDKYSKSTSGSLSTGDNSSSNSSQSTGSSFSGLGSGARGQIENAVLPGLTESAGKLSGIPSKYSEAANNLYREQTSSAMEELFPQIMENLGGRNMQNSSVASDAISKGMSEIAKEYGEKGYQSKMDEATLEMQLPQILAGLMELSKYSEGSNQSASAGGSSGKTRSESESLSENPQQPYEMWTDIFKAMLDL